MALSILWEMAKPKFKKLSENNPVSVRLEAFYNFAFNFDEILLTHFLTKKQLADKMGISIRTISRKTKDFRSFTVGEIMDINTILKDHRRKLKDLAGG